MGLGHEAQKKSLCSLTSPSHLTCIHTLWPRALWCSSNSVNECHYLYETARGLSHHYEPSSSIQHGCRLGTAQQEAWEPGWKQREVRVSLCPGDWSWNLGLLYRGSCSRVITDCSPPSKLVVNCMWIHVWSTQGSSGLLLMPPQISLYSFSEYTEHQREMKRYKPGIRSRSVWTYCPWTVRSHLCLGPEQYIYS